MKIEERMSLTYDDISIIPTWSGISSRGECELYTDIGEYSLATPLIASPMDTVCGVNMCIELSKLGGMGVLHRFQSIDEQVDMCDEIDANGVHNYMAAIGVGNSGIDRLDKLLKYSQVRGVCIDVANGHHSLPMEMTSYIKSEYPDIHVMVGNIVSKAGAMDLIKEGADTLRVGIGNGSMCETRIRAGVGVPQATALNDIYSFLEEELLDVALVADGGIKTTGDVAKALALGADAVMIGSLFSGTKETPGSIAKTGQWPNEKLFKKYQGSASIESKVARGEEVKNVEGNSKITPYKGKVSRIVQDINDGVRSSMSYVGAINLEEFRNNAKFCRVTQAGQIEAQPHGL